MFLIAWERIPQITGIKTPPGALALMSLGAQHSASDLRQKRRKAHHLAGHEAFLDLVGVSTVT
jgi:hypothetical protein